MKLDRDIEAVLFYKTEPITIKDLSKILELPLEEIDKALIALSERLEHGATRLVQLDDTVHLTTAPAVAPLIEKIRTEELSKDIGKAGAETLAIILYRGPIARSEIDFIRGVNSSFILRNLQIKGLIKRTVHKTDTRSFQYLATTKLLTHLGITKKEELHDYGKIMHEIDTYIKGTEQHAT